MPAKKLVCKFCKKTFDERVGLPGLLCCEDCDYSGRSGIVQRQKMYVDKHGQQREGEILFRGEA